MSEVAKTLLIIRKPPFGSIDSWEALRLSLSFYAAGTPVTILLEKSGVYNWISRIALESQDARSVSRLVRDIEKFEVPVYIISEDLSDCGMDSSDLASSYPKMIRKKDVPQLIFSHDHVLGI